MGSSLHVGMTSNIPSQDKLDTSQATEHGCTIRLLQQNKLEYSLGCWDNTWEVAKEMPVNVRTQFLWQWK